MALAVAHVGGNVLTGGTSAVSDSWTSVAGSRIVAIGHLFQNAGAATNGDMTDSKSNAYTLLGSLYGGASQPGIGIWESTGTVRGASHTVTFNPTAGAPVIANIAVVEITGSNPGTDFDATTFATLLDNAAPFSPWNIATAGAISGNQIAVYGVTTSQPTGNFAWTNPTGYTNIINQGNSALLVTYAGYKINETGTPTVGATRTDTNDTSGRILIATFKEAAPPGAGAPARIVPMMLRRMGAPGRPMLGFPLPSGDPVAQDVLVAASPVLGLGLSPAPIVKADVPVTPALALGSSPASVPSIAKLVTAALGLGSSPAPVPLVVVPLSSAVALGITPTATAVIGAADVTVTPSAALALGSTPAPVVLVTVPLTSAVGLGVAPNPLKLVVVPLSAALAAGVTPAPVAQIVKTVTAALAAGSTPAPVVNVVVPLSAAVALGSTPAPTVIIAGNVIVTVGPAIALGSTPAPVVQVARVVTASVAAGTTVNPAQLVRVLTTAATALGVAPSPTVIAGFIQIAAALAVADTAGVVVVASEPVQPAGSASEPTGVAAGASELPGVSISTDEQTGARVVAVELDP